MPFHNNRLTFGQTMTEGNRIQREAAMAGGPQPFGQGPGFDQAVGLELLGDRESRMLQRVVARLKRQREGLQSAALLGRGFGL